MDALAVQERQKYERLWSLFPDEEKNYPSDFLTPVFLSYFQNSINSGDSVIDFGCGGGKSAAYLLNAGLQVKLVDFCDNYLNSDIFLLSCGAERKVEFFQECLWDLSNSLKPADWILSFDVLEHIPESKVDAVLQAMSLRMKKGGLFSICLRNDECGKWIGETLHLTVKPQEWWKEKVLQWFSIDRELANVPMSVVWAISPRRK